MNRFQLFLNSLRGRLLISHMVIALASLSIAGVVVTFGIVPIYTALTYTRMEDSLSLAYAATQAVSLPGSQDVPRFFGQRDRDENLATPTAPRSNNRPDFGQGDGFDDPQQFLTQRFNFVFQRQLEGQNLRMLLVDLDTRLITFDSATEWEGQAWAFQMAKCRAHGHGDRLDHHAPAPHATDPQSGQGGRAHMALCLRQPGPEWRGWDGLWHGPFGPQHLFDGCGAIYAGRPAHPLALGDPVRLGRGDLALQRLADPIPDPQPATGDHRHPGDRRRQPGLSGARRRLFPF